MVLLSVLDMLRDSSVSGSSSHLGTSYLNPDKTSPNVTKNHLASLSHLLERTAILMEILSESDKTWHKPSTKENHLYKCVYKLLIIK